MAKKTLDLSKPRLFTSSNIRKILAGSTPRVRKVRDVEAGTTSSFRYDGLGVGLKSTQQSNIDFSKFENHTFFNSAVVNTNISFDKIINFYPFDGTKKEKEAFEDRLSGFERHVLDTWPRTKGYLNFGQSEGGDRSFISVEDMSGIQNPALSRNDTAAPALDPGKKSVSIEFHLLLPDNSQFIDTQIICQKIDSTSRFGYSVGTLPTAAAASGSTIVFSVCSGTANLTTTMPINRGRFDHIALVFNRDGESDKLSLYRNTKLITTSSERADIGKFGSGFRSSNFLIGTGSSFTTSSFDPSVKFSPKATFTGSLDEFRVHHKALTSDDINTSISDGSGMFKDNFVQLGSAEI